MNVPIQNTDFRTTLWTGCYAQMTLLCRYWRTITVSSVIPDICLFLGKNVEGIEDIAESNGVPCNKGTFFCCIGMICYVLYYKVMLFYDS